MKSSSMRSGAFSVNTSRARSAPPHAVENRLPAFLIIGAMKAGTTTLFEWLASHPQVLLPKVKEPNFFSDDRRWRRGLVWYADLFPVLAPGFITGEASVEYTSARDAPVAAARIANTLDSVRIIYLVRDPVERLRSHYRHEVQRGRERRALVPAIRANPEYTGRSMYWERLRPYTERLARDQILVVTLESLSTDPLTWTSVLEHLGLPDCSRPAKVANRSVDKDGLTRLGGLLWQTGLLHRPTSRVPRLVRRGAWQIVTSRSEVHRRRLAASMTPLPPSITAPLWDEAAKLASWLQCPGPLWSSPD